MRKRSAYRMLISVIIFVCFFSYSNLYGQLFRSILQGVGSSSNKSVSAKFSFSPFIIVAGAQVKFLDKSTGSPTGWLWDFGDGTTSNEQNPSHIYQNPGAYSVSLTANASSISSKATKKIRVYGSKAKSSSQSIELAPNFNFSPSTPEVGLAVQFTDSSTGNPVSWTWDFGDGEKSTNQNPQHQYQNSGIFNVTLTVSNGASSKSLTKTITVIPALTPGFSFSPVNPEAGELIQFQDSTSGNPSAWSWNFGDGSTSNLQNPSHLYNNAGTYTVTLQISNGDYTKTVSKTITVLAPITVGFSYSPANPVVGQDVQFSNTSTGSITSYSWNFGDGSSSTLKDPVHKYSAAGNFTVTLTATNAKGSKSKSQTIIVNQSISPSFSYSPASPYAGQAVQFTDSSSGNPTSWSWDFGDGSVSNLQSPTHAYSSAGTYTVTLTASNGLETKTASKTINVKAVIQADFTYSPTNPTAGTQIQFTDKSTGSITSWSWQFGDGGTSSQKNPTKTYSTAGSYNVKLTISDGTTSNSMTQTVTVVASLAANFTLSPNSPAVGQEVQFLDNSQGSPISWSWDFGDGGKSTAKNPTHTYSQAGAYTVKLVISDGTNSSTKSKSLTVSSTSTSKVITASSCTLADVQAAIATAKAGDTVVVPNGTATWGSQLYITKGITLKAASVGGVTIIAGFEGKNWSNDNFLIRFQPQDPANNKTFRLSGFKLDCNNKVDAILLVNTSTTEEINQVRIDHNEISNLQTDINARYLETDGLIWGVADNNIFHNDDTDAVYRTWQALGYNGGQSIWQNHPFNFGSEKQFYFEDNTFYTKNILVGCGGGGRYCLRHNDIIVKRNSIITVYMFDLHGNMGSGQNWGGIGCELYDNRIDMGNNGLNLIDARGGKALIYNNTISNLGQYQSVYYQVREEYNDSLNPPAKHSVSGQPQYVSETYFFNQVINGSKPLPPNVNVTQTIDYGGSEGIVPREDFNYFREKASFDGSSGVGVGPVAQRPAYCSKEGAAWWATDENKLYRWHAGTWEIYYTPYTYPHPLRNKLND